MTTETWRVNDGGTMRDVLVVEHGGVWMAFPRQPSADDRVAAMRERCAAAADRVQENAKARAEHFRRAGNDRAASAPRVEAIGAKRAAKAIRALPLTEAPRG